MTYQPESTQKLRAYADFLRDCYGYYPIDKQTFLREAILLYVKTVPQAAITLSEWNRSAADADHLTLAVNDAMREFPSGKRGKVVKSILKRKIAEGLPPIDEIDDPKTLSLITSFMDVIAVHDDHIPTWFITYAGPETAFQLFQEALERADS